MKNMAAILKQAGMDPRGAVGGDTPTVLKNLNFIVVLVNNIFKLYKFATPKFEINIIYCT